MHKRLFHTNLNTLSLFDKNHKKDNRNEYQLVHFVGSFWSLLIHEYHKIAIIMKKKMFLHLYLLYLVRIKSKLQ